jgi:chromosome segregation ATPase
MKQKNLLISLLAASAFAVGCEQSDKAATENRDATAKQLDRVQTETKAAAQDMKDNTYAQKTEFVQKMQGQLTELNRDLDQLTAKIEKSSAPIKAEAQPKLQLLRDQIALLNKQLDEAKNATESTWDSVKEGFKKAYAASKDGVQQARQWVSDKIAP